MTWYICVLLLCYIFYWLILWIAQRLRVTPVYMEIFMIFAGLGIGTYGISAPFFNLQSSRGYTAFFSGVLLNYIMKYIPKKKLKWISVIMLAFTALAGLINYTELYDNICGILMFIIYPCIVILVMTSKTTDFLMNRKIFQILGAVSFNMYLWHIPCLMGLALIWRLKGITPSYSYADMLIITLGIGLFSYCIYRYVEIPVTDKLLKRIQKG